MFVLNCFMAGYDFKKVEEKWQKKWDEEKTFQVGEKTKNPYYVLEMFAYPSGLGLHIGHTWNYTLGDIMSRFKIMKGFDVLHPVGYDSLGLPAENAAIKEGTHPKKYTDDSIKNFIKQQKKLGLSYDWSRLLSTADPEYYKWDQWIFLKMFERGLAYQKESNVNWCPTCKTVLANEQSQGGLCERCGSNVQVRYLKQWFLKITDYADELYEGIDNLIGWPERTRAMQKNWIGKSYGVEIDFEVNGKKWPVFTTRPDTIFGVTFLVLSANHPKVYDFVTDRQKKEVERYLKKVNSVSEKNISEMEKIGVFTGSYAINPATEEEVPIYLGNFVVADYGSGMVMAVPAHDQRDFEFAKKYKIKIKQVIEGKVTDKRAYTGEGKLINSQEFNGINSNESKEKITEWLLNKEVGRRVVNFRLRDWGISRQRYWGTPIPIIHCQKCGAVPVPDKDLPVKLPDKVKFGKGNPLETNDSWAKTTCPTCGGRAQRETDTMDTFVNSSWYFMRFCDPKNNKKIFDPDKVNHWCPVNTYIGGAEHACMHLIYARFYTKFLRDIGLVKFDEPAIRLFHQGMIYGEDGEKMSKSRGNVIEPLEIIKKYGVDALRFFLVSVASPDKDFLWSETGIIGAERFLSKVYDYSVNPKFVKDPKEVLEKLNETIKNVEEYYENFEYRKATIEVRELFEVLSNGSSKETFKSFLKILSPICPHITEEIWSSLGGEGLISKSYWPKFNKKVVSEKKEIDVNLKVINLIKDYMKGKSVKKVYLYALPFEINKYDATRISKEVGRDVVVYSVTDPKKVDPEKKSKKAKPTLPGIWFE